MQVLTLHDIDVREKKILLRVDFNVPLSESGEIEDDERIKQSTATIKYLLSHRASIILISHLGRPSGQVVQKLSLAPIGKKLEELLGHPVNFIPDCIGDNVRKCTSKMEPMQIVLLENLRFHPGEEHPQEHPEFAEHLARYADIYLNDAFGTCHRKHASIYDVPQQMPVSAAGLLVEKEIMVLSNLLTQAENPFHAIIGGSKVSSKIGILESLMQRVDRIFIGGAMAFTFLKVKGYEVGRSLVEEGHLDEAKSLYKKAKSRGVTLHLPEDLLAATSLTKDAKPEVFSVNTGLPPEMIGGDIGPKTVEEWKHLLSEAKTIFWNGPLGVAELVPFQKGTLEIGRAIAKGSAMSIVGGGDSIAAIKHLHLDQKITHMSTGGGATLEFIEHQTLPGLEVLNQKPSLF